ncbi:larval cuticle protein 1-like [Anopheles albimanus]|uniref:larval cuticle protein 1-like n=1 Tax=Anopheles albimanus TaxID=7167 RepID=UPI00164069E1|nr:larval cuticle protein 1-like [Anopheles albimanus]
MKLAGEATTLGISLLLWVSMVSAAPAEDSEAMLVNYESVQMREMYRFMYETDDGQYREEVGMLVNVGTPDEELMTMGRYGYTSKDGTEVMVMYTSGKNGYRARTVSSRSSSWDSGAKKKALLSLLMG